MCLPLSRHVVCYTELSEIWWRLFMCLLCSPGICAKKIKIMIFKEEECHWKYLHRTCIAVRSIIQHVYPVSDFWQISSCSRRWGSRWIKVSSPTQHWRTLALSWACCISFTQVLSMFWNRLATYMAIKDYLLWIKLILLLLHFHHITRWFGAVT